MIKFTPENGISIEAKSNELNILMMIYLFVLHFPHDIIYNKDII